MTVLEVANLVKRYWFRMLVVTLVGAAIGLTWASLQPKMYASTASAIVTTGPSESVGTAAVAARFAQDRVKSYESLVHSRTLAEYAIHELGLKVGTSSVISQVTGVVPPNSSVLQITAIAGKPSAATRLAEAWVQGMIFAVDKLESAGSRDGNLKSIVRLASFDSATTPKSPYFPDVNRAIAIGALAGFLLGCGFIAILSRLDLRVKTPKQITDNFALSVIGSLPFNQGLRSREKNSNLANSSNASNNKQARENRILDELVKKLRTNLNFINVDNPPKRIVITSALPDEGKSTVTLLLANALAEVGKTVFIIDADLRLRSLARAAGVLESPGLTDVLVQSVGLEESLQKVGNSGRLFILAAGMVPPNPSELLSSDAFSALLDNLATRGMVLIDAPPLIPVTDASIATAKADGALLVVRAGVTKLPQVEQAIAAVTQVNGKILGVALNGVTKKNSSDGDAYYSAYYGEKRAGRLKKLTKRRERR